MMNGVRKIANWSEDDGYELTSSHASLYIEEIDAALALRKIMIRALSYFRAHPYRRIDAVAEVIGWTKSHIATLAGLGVFPAEKRQAMCADGQLRCWWFVDIYAAVEFRSLLPSERRKIMRAIRAGRREIDE